MRTNMKKWELKRKVKRAEDRYLGDKGYLSDKFKNIYGGGDYSEEIEKIRNSNRNRYILCTVVILMVFALFIKDNIMAGADIKADENGFVKEISRDDKNKDVFVSMEVYGQRDGEVFKKSVDINAGLQDKAENTSEANYEEDDEAMLGYRIDEAARIAASEESDRIILPDRLSDGTRVFWKQQEQSSWIFLILIVPVLFYAVYRSRFNYVNRKEEQSRESVMKELPEFLGRLTLLLGAGMVLTSAFERIIDDRRSTQMDNDTYFYNQMKRIAEDFKRTNRPIHKGIEDFAKRSRIKEFIRVSGIISDNVDKGTELIQKLDAESGAMWFARKQNMEEKGRMAESKLIAPLMLMLVILIVITVAPALMEM